MHEHDEHEQEHEYEQKQEPHPSETGGTRSIFRENPLSSDCMMPRLDGRKRFKRYFGASATLRPGR